MKIIKTDEEIKREIQRLDHIKKNVPRFPTPREDNWKAIEAQIFVLRHKLTKQGIFNKWPRCSRDVSVDYLRDNALNAYEWMRGVIYPGFEGICRGDLFDDWNILAKSKRLRLRLLKNGL